MSTLLTIIAILLAIIALLLAMRVFGMEPVLEIVVPIGTFIFWGFGAYGIFEIGKGIFFYFYTHPDDRPYLGWGLIGLWIFYLHKTRKDHEEK